mmetsp:Transcript_89598/g.289743  ORF Transcript_89598/g.289743 Transcript_89598/m.289743 type:complete len:117 (+) Transcript_89598:291-641(+)
MANDIDDTIVDGYNTKGKKHDNIEVDAFGDIVGGYLSEGACCHDTAGRGIGDLAVDSVWRGRSRDVRAGDDSDNSGWQFFGTVRLRDIAGNDVDNTTDGSFVNGALCDLPPWRATF